VKRSLLEQKWNVQNGCKKNKVSRKSGRNLLQCFSDEIEETVSFGATQKELKKQTTHLHDIYPEKGLIA